MLTLDCSLRCSNDASTAATLVQRGTKDFQLLTVEDDPQSLGTGKLIKDPMKRMHAITIYS